MNPGKLPQAIRNSSLRLVLNSVSMCFSWSCLLLGERFLSHVYRISAKTKDYFIVNELGGVLYGHYASQRSNILLHVGQTGFKGREYDFGSGEGVCQGMFCPLSRLPVHFTPPASPSQVKLLALREAPFSDCKM